MIGVRALERNLIYLCKQSPDVPTVTVQDTNSPRRNNPMFSNPHQGIPNIKDLVRKQKQHVLSEDSIEFIKREVQHKLSFEDLEKWMHQEFEKAEKENNRVAMKQMSMTNDLISNILIQYTMSRYPGRLVWLDPTTGKKVE